MVTWCVIMCPGAGPLIETITVKFKTRADCGDWHDKISGQIRAARQSAVLPSKLSLQPVPPPHVSSCFLLGFYLSLLVTLTCVISCEPWANGPNQSFVCCPSVPVSSVYGMTVA